LFFFLFFLLFVCAVGWRNKDVLAKAIRTVQVRVYMDMCNCASIVLLFFLSGLGLDLDIGFYRAMHFSAKRGIAIACRLSVRLSVCNVGGL